MSASLSFLAIRRDRGRYLSLSLLLLLSIYVCDANVELKRVKVEPLHISSTWCSRKYFFSFFRSFLISFPSFDFSVSSLPLPPPPLFSPLPHKHSLSSYTQHSVTLKSGIVPLYSSSSSQSLFMYVHFYSHVLSL